MKEASWSYEKKAKNWINNERHQRRRLRTGSKRRLSRLIIGSKRWIGIQTGSKRHKRRRLTTISVELEMIKELESRRRSLRRLTVECVSEEGDRLTRRRSLS
ncbi:hypothetical protein Q3G72_001880 [Acer saccharum]|nr:hypothetical protein Q3G72_001880 [Acer saccharum]